jgi:2-hydroxychromene-2-carboxylate isomerase
MMRHIDCYITPVSPWLYLSGERPAALAERHGVALRYKPVDPTQLFARTGGLPLGQRHESRQDYRLQELTRWARVLDMPLTLRPRHFPTNPAPASYAIIAAQAAGGGDTHALVQALARACWAEERDIADDGVIGDCLEASGFDRGLTMSGLLTGAETYERNLREALEEGVFGFPFFVIEGQRFWGQDRLEHLDLYLQGKLTA